MKKFIALGFGCLLAQGAFAQDNAAVKKVVPALPEACEDQIADNGLYCSSRSIEGNKTTVTFAAVVSKSSFPTVADTTDDLLVANALLTRYSDFTRWPEFASVSPEKVIEFNKGGSKALTPIENADGTVTLRHVYDYQLKIQGIPLLKQAVKGTTYNTVVDPYEGAVASLVFEAQLKANASDEVAPKGLKSQVGSIHAIKCDAEVLSVCDETKLLLVYETTVQPDVSFAMGIAADTVTAGIEDLLIGMLDESIVDPVVEAPAAEVPAVEAPAAL